MMQGAHGAPPLTSASDVEGGQGMTRNAAPVMDGAASWRIAAGCLIGMAVAFGPALVASFGLYLKPISEEFSWSRTEVAVAYSIFSVIGALGSPFLGIFLDRYGSRGILIGTSIVFPVVLALLVLVPHNYAVFLGWSVLAGLLAITSSPAAYINLIPQWFDRRLGLAVALGMTGSALGQAIFTIAHGNLLARMPWRDAWLVMVGIVAVVGIINALFLLRDRPDFLKLRRSGRQSELEGYTVSEALGTLAYWSGIVAFFIVMLVIGGMLTHLVPLLTDRDVPIEKAGSIVAMIGIVSFVGRLMAGFVIDRVGFGVLGALIFPMQAVGCFVLWQGLDGAWLHLAAGMIGLAYGVEADMLPFMLRRTFGIRSFGKLYGLSFGFMQLGPVIGPILLGFSFDQLGSYTPALQLLSILSCISAVLVVLSSKLSAQVIAARKIADENGN